MKFEGIHHVTAITADAQDNVDFYAGVLGLRLVKKTVNQDDPSVYHVFYSDEGGHAGSDITFFEFPGAPRGRAGDGMVHTVIWRVGSPESLEFWAQRLADNGIPVGRGEGSLDFDDPEGLSHELRVSHVTDEPLIARHPDVPTEHALQGFEAVRAFASAPEGSEHLLRELGFDGAADTWEARGESRGGLIYYDVPAGRGGSAGSRNRSPRRLGLDAGGTRAVA